MADKLYDRLCKLYREGMYFLASGLLTRSQEQETRGHVERLGKAIDMIEALEATED